MKVHGYLFPFSAVCVLFLTFFVCYLVTLSDEHYDHGSPFPFVSATGDRLPESSLFTFGLSIGLALLAVGMLLRHALLSPLLPRGFNVSVLICGLLGVAGAMGVAMAPFSQFPNVHMTCAVGGFLAQGAYMLAVSAIDVRLRMPLRAARAAMAVVAVVFFAVCAAFFAAFKWGYADLPDDAPEKAALRHASGVFEYLMICMGLLWFCFSSVDLYRADVKISLDIVPPPASSISAPQDLESTHASSLFHSDDDDYAQEEENEAL